MSKPRKITTMKELEALPVYSLIQEYDGFKRVKVASKKWLLCVTAGGTESNDTIELPAIVLYEPEEEN